jgi:hypothetical protein
MKDQLVFDVTDVNTIADSDSVGAFVRAGTDGELIDSTDNALWVHIKAADVSLDVDLEHTEDSVALGDGTSLLTSTTIGADIGLDVYILNSSIDVTATDLDIRDLSASQDNVAISDGTYTLAINADGSINAVLSATDLDIRDLDYNSDSVTAYQGTDPWVVNDAALGNTAIQSSADTLTAAGTAEKVVASNLTNRKYLFVYNNFNRRIYIGGSDVDKDNGFPIAPRSYVELRAGAAVDVYYDSEANSAAIRVLEVS